MLDNVGIVNGEGSKQFILFSVSIFSDLSRSESVGRLLQNFKMDAELDSLGMF